MQDSDRSKSKAQSRGNDLDTWARIVYSAITGGAATGLIGTVLAFALIAATARGRFLPEGQLVFGGIAVGGWALIRTLIGWANIALRHGRHNNSFNRSAS